MPFKQHADDSVFTYFWANNFNKKVDSEKGTNMIDSTHLIKFREESPWSVYQTMSKTVPKDKTKISCFPLLDQDKLYINARKEPQIFEFQEGNRSCNEVFKVQYLLWRILHYLTTDKQNFLTLTGSLVILRKLEVISALAKKTVVAYLPPINTSVNNFSTVFQFLTYMQSLCQEASMPYVK